MNTISVLKVNVEKVKSGSIALIHGEEMEVTNVRANGFPRDKDGNSTDFTLTLDNHRHSTYVKGTKISILRK